MKKAASTRLPILNKAFELIYMYGYQATSVDKIIETTDVTKGAFFYHFKSKDEMGLAMIREIVAPRLRALLIDPLYNSSPNVIDTINNTITRAMDGFNDYDVRHGCPINNLVQELSPINESFRLSLQKILEEWNLKLADLIEEGKEQGQIRGDVNSKTAALFIVVSYEGMRGIGKVYQNHTLYASYVEQLNQYLNSLT